MAIPKKVIKFLEKAKVRYEPVQHRQVYTACDKAATLKVKSNIIGKTLILRADKDLAIVLVSANRNLDLRKLKKLAKCKKLDFVSEKIIKQKFKGVKIGAIPPFGNLWGFPVFADKILLKEPKIIINAGDYKWSIKITSAVLRKTIPDLVIGSFSQTRK